MPGGAHHRLPRSLEAPGFQEHPQRLLERGVDALGLAADAEQTSYGGQQVRLCDELGMPHEDRPILGQPFRRESERALGSDPRGNGHKKRRRDDRDLPTVASAEDGCGQHDPDYQAGWGQQDARDRYQEQRQQRTREGNVVITMALALGLRSLRAHSRLQSAQASGST